MAAIAGRVGDIEVGGNALGGLVDANLSVSVDELETTDHDSTGTRTYIPNLSSATLSGNVRWDEASAGQDTLLDNTVPTPTVFTFKFDMAGSAATGLRRFSGSGFCTSLSPGMPLDGTATMDFEIRITSLTLTTIA